MNFDVPPGDPRSFKAASLGVKRLANVLALIFLPYGILVSIHDSQPELMILTAGVMVTAWLSVRLIDWVIRGFRKG